MAGQHFAVRGLLEIENVEGLRGGGDDVRRILRSRGCRGKVLRVDANAAALEESGYAAE
jgi:hypothetical protein